MSPSFVVPQAIPGSERQIFNLKYLLKGNGTFALCCLKTALTLILKTFLFVVLPQSTSTPESFIAEVARENDSFKMVCFNVVFY